jgi:hypothetical protein
MPWKSPVGLHHVCHEEVRALRIADESGGFYRSLGSTDAPRRRTEEEVGVVVKERVNGRFVANRRS